MKHVKFISMGLMLPIGFYLYRFVDVHFMGTLFTQVYRHIYEIKIGFGGGEECFV